MTPLPAGETRYLTVETAAHAAGGFEHLTRHLRDAVSLATAHHVAYYDDGLPYVSVDLLDHPRVVAAGADGQPTPAHHRRRELEFVGRQLNHVLREIEQRMEGADSGGLIHAVFDVGVGAVLYHQVHNRSYLVSATFFGGPVDGLGRAMATTTGELRADRSLPDRNPGGHRSQSSDSHRTLPPTNVEHVVEQTVGAAPDALFLELAPRYVDPITLHYASVFADGAWNCSEDVLGAANLGRFSLTTSPRRRREAYQRIGREFRRMNATLDRTVRGVMRSRLVRATFDLDEGAMYFERVDPGLYLMGVTLDQSQVKVAGDRFTDLVAKLRSHRQAVAP